MQGNSVPPLPRYPWLLRGTRGLSRSVHLQFQAFCYELDFQNAFWIHGEKRSPLQPFPMQNLIRC
jgi:hypothetical protein